MSDVIKTNYHEKYGKDGNNGDSVAVKLKKMSREGMFALSSEVCNIDIQSRWGSLNTGMQRMNFGNVLRKMVNTKDVKLGQIDEYIKKFPAESANENKVEKSKTKAVKNETAKQATKSVKQSSGKEEQEPDGSPTPDDILGDTSDVHDLL